MQRAQEQFEKSEAQRLQNAMLARSKYDASMSIRENNLQRYPEAVG
jgi:hypothetical protein